MNDPLQSALALHQSGRLPEAEPVYRQALAADPNSAQAMHFLGMLLCQTSRGDEGLQRMQQAVKLDPGNILYRLNLGAIYNQMKRPSEALAVLEPAMSGGAAVPELFNNYGLALFHLSRIPEAVGALRHALAVAPDHAAAHYNLALALQAAGDHAGAVTHFQNAKARGANPPRFYAEMAQSLVRLARWDELLDALQKAIAADPGNLDLRVNYANTLFELRRWDDAAIAFEAILAAHPRDVDVLNNLAFLRYQQGRMDEAVAAYEKAATIAPSAGDIHANWGAAVLQQGRHKEALGLLRKAAALAPRYTSSLLMAMHYSTDTPAEEIAAAHVAWGRTVTPASIAPHTNNRDLGRKLRIGYISPDFRQHAVATFLEPLFAAHDRAQFEIICLANVKQRDAATDHFRSRADKWVEIVGMSDEAAASLIRELQVDILVDLAGHTNDHRLGVLALKPAPIQGTYLGYPDTTGLATVDFRLTDVVADPVGMTEQYYTERLVRLPGCFLCFTPPAHAPEVSALPALRTKTVTYACFAAFQKMTPAMFELWAQILHRVPGSRLLLKRNALAPGQTARKRVLDAFAAQGVEASRVELEGGTLNSLEHLQRYGEVDIMLDTFPYTGTTMTCESLWMGVPVVTMAGQTHVSRVATSILTAAGLTELVADTPERYVAVAVALGRDLEGLGRMRGEVRRRLGGSPVGDRQGLAGHVEGAYRELWQAWAGGR